MEQYRTFKDTEHEPIRTDQAERGHRLIALMDPEDLTAPEALQIMQNMVLSDGMGFYTAIGDLYAVGYLKGYEARKREENTE